MTTTQPISGIRASHSEITNKPALFHPSVAFTTEQLRQLTSFHSILKLSPLAAAGSTPSNVRDKIKEAYQLKFYGLLKEAANTFAQLLQRADSTDCPPELAKGTLQHINCLVGYVESLNAPDQRENLESTKKALEEIKGLLETQLKDHQAEYILFTLQNYLKRLYPFTSSEDFSILMDLLKRCAEKIRELRGSIEEASSSTLEGINVTTEEPSSVQLWAREFFKLICFFVFAGCFIALCHRHIMQIKALDPIT